MKLIKEIRDDDLTKDSSSLKLREASRAILFDEHDLIPLLFVSKQNYHKLPGGGVDGDESKLQALIRECLEEVGCEIEVTGEIGKIIEVRSKWEMKQVSYCYTGKIISKGKPDLTQSEFDEVFEIKWFNLNDAIKTLENDKPLDYLGNFVKKRDLIFLKSIL